MDRVLFILIFSPHLSHQQNKFFIFVTEYLVVVQLLDRRVIHKLVTCASRRWNTSRLFTEATKQKRLHLVDLMCIAVDLGRPNCFLLITEVQKDHTLLSGGKSDKDEEGDEEEKGNMGGWRSVAFPKVAAEQEDASKVEEQSVLQLHLLLICVTFPLLSSQKHEVRNN